MDSINLGRGRVVDGLRLMARAADDAEEIVHGYVDVPTALLVIEMAKRAEDRDEWFPAGKWATIQNIQSNVDLQLRHLFHAPAGVQGTRPVNPGDALGRCFDCMWAGKLTCPHTKRTAGVKEDDRG